MSRSRDMKPDILLLDRFSPSAEAKLDAGYRVHRLFAGPFDFESHGAKIKAIVTSGAKGAPRAVVDRLPSLELIAIRGIGTDGVDLDLARGRSVDVTTTPGLLTDDVADLAIALLLAVARQVCISDRFVRGGKWVPGSSLPLARKVTGMKLGIVGFGRVGQAVAARASGFKAEIAYTDLRLIPDMPYRFVQTVAELAAGSDALILAASGGPQSERIIDATALAALGPQGILVNVARGSLVDEAALVAALASGALGGAGLDVFVDEPKVPAALLGLDNVVLQPHRASATAETRTAMEDLVLANLEAHFAGRPLLSPVL
ncbi:MAG TPA: 2-hydroxyacid dehydrogenase [Bradyrhizobium sp.]|nr:2-hydroxyacid dehydrogenase [Bradyrhizobium sp.]